MVKGRPMNMQEWHCEICEAEGAVPYEEYEDVFSVIHKIDADHYQHCPVCPQPYTRLRLGKLPRRDARSEAE